MMKTRMDGDKNNHHNVGGKLIALCLLLLVFPQVQAQTVEYIHTDALGSPIAVTDANQNVIERSEYSPYGDLLNRPDTDGPGYTGHVLDAATGLNYMQQRYYDPAIGMFLSVDPVAAHEQPGSNFNRYWYGNNSPYKFLDPDGRAVSLAGAPDDQKKFIQQTHQLTGSTVASDKRGNLSITARNPKLGAPGAAAALDNAINSRQQISLTAVSSDPGVFIDSYATGKVDVDDIGNFAATDNNLGAAALTHVLTEYTAAMQAGGMTQTNFAAAHAAGLSAESAVMGAASRTSTGIPTPGSNFGVQYQSADGRTIKSYNFLLDKNGTP